MHVLLAAGASPDATDRDGRTALMCAVERGSQWAVAALVCAGANPTLAADDGSTAESLARAWQRQIMRFMFGETSVGLEMIDRPRSVMEIRPMVVRLRGDASLFACWSRVVEHALADLGDDEFETLVGCKATDAHRVSAALAADFRRTEHSDTLMQLDMPRDDLNIVRGALLNLAYGPKMTMPSGMTQTEIIDLFEEVNTAGI